MTSPDASFGSQNFFCSSVPPPISALVRISGRVISEPAAASDARESSSVVRIMARLPISTPPYSSGIERPKKPSSAMFSMNSSGIVASVRWMCSAWGITSFAPNSRTWSRTCSCISSSTQSLRPAVAAASAPISRSRDSAVVRRRAARTSAGKAFSTAASPISRSSAAIESLSRKLLMSSPTAAIAIFSRIGVELPSADQASSSASIWWAATASVAA